MQQARLRGGGVSRNVTLQSFGPKLMCEVLIYFRWGLTLLFLFFYGLASAAGFDCGHARSPIETYICLDYRLSDLDGAINELYVSAIQRQKENGLLEASQKRWLSLRNKCTSPECLIKSYRSRIAELSPSNPLAKEPAQVLPWDFIAPKGMNVSELYVANTKVDHLLVSISKWGVPRTYLDYASKNQITIDHNWATSGLSYIKVQGEEYRELKDIRAEDLGTAKPFGNQQYIQSSQAFTGYCGPREDADALDFYPRGNNISDISASRSLIGFLNHETSVGIAPTCDEINLPIDQNAIGSAYVFNDSFFLETLGGQALIRFNEEFYSGSPLIGREVILAWESDLRQILNKQCGNANANFATPECLQKQLARLIQHAHKGIH